MSRVLKTNLASRTGNDVCCTSARLSFRHIIVNIALTVRIDEDTCTSRSVWCPLLVVRGLSDFLLDQISGKAEYRMDLRDRFSLVRFWRDSHFEHKVS